MPQRGAQGAVGQARSTLTSSFRVASGVEGTVVEGSHSWLLADPQHFSEVITNDVRVAQAARDLERGLDHTKQRGLRRVPTLRRRKAVSVPPPEGPLAAG